METWVCAILWKPLNPGLLTRAKGSFCLHVFVNEVCVDFAAKKVRIHFRVASPGNTGDLCSQKPGSLRVS